MNKIFTLRKGSMVTLFWGISIFAPVIHVCGVQAHFPPFSDTTQGYDESTDAMYSSHENPNFSSGFPQNGFNDAGRKGNITNPIYTSSSAEKKKICLLGSESEYGTYDGHLRSQDEGNLYSLYAIVVDGNIASGKTTFLNLFMSYQQALRLPPLPSQNHGITKTIRIMERSLFSDRFVFLEDAHHSGKISNPEYALMKQWFNFSMDKFRKQIIPDLIVYLRCPLEVLKQRVMSRGHFESVNDDYLEGKQKRYEDYLLYKNSSFPVPSKVMVLDGGLSLDNFARSVHDKLPTLFPSWKLLRGLQRRKSGRGKKL